MNLRAAHTHWSRADAPERARVMDALRALQVGQRLRLADVLAPATNPNATGDDAGQRDAAAPQQLVEYVSAGIRAGQVDTTTRECELSFSSEQPYERWWGVEVLGHASGECDMSWIASGRAPLLADHDMCEQIGVVTRAWQAAGKGRAVVRFGSSERAQQEMQDAADAVRVNVSVGYEIRELELVKQEGDQRTYRVTDWMPLEVSLVSIPADMTVGIGRGASSSSMPATPKEPAMTAQQQIPPVSGDAAYRANVEKIATLAKSYGEYLKPNDMTDAIARGADPEAFNSLIMERLKTRATDVTTTAGVGMGAKEVEQYSFLRAIQSMIPGSNVDAGLEREVSKAIGDATGRSAEGIFIPTDVFAGKGLRASIGANGKRDFTAGTAGEAGNLVQTSLATGLYTDVLRAKLVLAQLGVTVLTGLRSNVAIPRKTVAGTLAMLAEVAGAAETQPTTALATLSPHRISAYTEPSKQAIIQSEIGIEGMIRDDLVTGAAVLAEYQAINGSGTAPNLRGIRNVSGIGSVVGGANGAALTWAHITGLEAACANANAGATDRAGYLVNTKAVNTTKNTQKAANLPFIWDGGDMPLNGYRAGVTNNVPSNLTKGTSSGVCSSLVFSSDWSMFVLAFFGGLDVTVDPYTLATTGQVRITLNQFIDAACRQPGAFASMDDALTA